MDEDRIDRLLEKAAYIETSLELLADKQQVEFGEFTERTELKDVVERRFVTMTQACIDIARMVLVSQDVTPPESNAGTIRELARRDVLSERTADLLAESCRFRNVLAHEYGPVIDDRSVYDALQDLQRYRDFVVEVRDFLREEGAL